MDAQAFWSVVSAYNQQTLAAQIALLLLVLAAAVLSYSNKAKWAAKFALGIIHLFIGVAFFACHGAAPVQKYFALPLYLICGLLSFMKAIATEMTRSESLMRKSACCCCRICFIR